MDIQHPPGEGSVKRYREGCRCQECRDVWAEYHRARRAEKSAARTAATATTGGELGGTGLAAWWDAIAAERETASRAEARGVRELADPADGGADCPRCGAPMRWAGGYTALICIKHRPGAWLRDTGARARAARRAERVRPRDTGPSAAEQHAAAAESAVIADDIDGAREVLALIPREHPWRAEAVRARHRLGELAERCRAARTLAAADDAAADAESLYDEIGEVIRQARKIEARAARRDNGGARRGGLLRMLRGDDGEYAYDEDQGDEDQDSEDQGAELADEGAPRVIAAAANPWTAWDTAAREAARAVVINGHGRAVINR